MICIRSIKNFISCGKCPSIHKKKVNTNDDVEEVENNEKNTASEPTIAIFIIDDIQANK